MPQTLLALLAMIVTTLLAFSQQRNAIANYEHMVENEIEMAASGALMHVLELIGSRSFDERTTPEGLHAAGTLPASPTAFEIPALFGGHAPDKCNLEKPFLTPACDDIDDVHGADVVVPIRLANGNQIDFDVQVEVSYVSDVELSTVSLVPTYHKMAVVTATSDLLPHRTIELRRVFSYDPVKAEVDYEDTYGDVLDG